MMLCLMWTLCRLAWVCKVFCSKQKQQQQVSFEVSQVKLALGKGLGLDGMIVWGMHETAAGFGTELSMMLALFSVLLCALYHQHLEQVSASAEQ